MAVPVREGQKLPLEQIGKSMMRDHRARAEQARHEMTEAVYEFVASAEGVTNAEVARALGLQSSSLGGQQNHLTHALLADLVRTNRVTLDSSNGRKRYVRV